MDQKLLASKNYNNPHIDYCQKVIEASTKMSSFFDNTLVGYDVMEKNKNEVLKNHEDIKAAFDKFINEYLTKEKEAIVLKSVLFIASSSQFNQSTCSSFFFLLWNSSFFVQRTSSSTVSANAAPLPSESTQAIVVSFINELISALKISRKYSCLRSATYVLVPLTIETVTSPKASTLSISVIRDVYLLLQSLIFGSRYNQKISELLIKALNTTVAGEGNTYNIPDQLKGLILSYIRIYERFTSLHRANYSEIELRRLGNKIISDVLNEKRVDQSLRQYSWVMNPESISSVAFDRPCFPWPEGVWDLSNQEHNSADVVGDAAALTLMSTSVPQVRFHLQRGTTFDMVRGKFSDGKSFDMIVRPDSRKLFGCVSEYSPIREVVQSHLKNQPVALQNQDNPYPLSFSLLNNDGLERSLYGSIWNGEEKTTFYGITTSALPSLHLDKRTIEGVNLENDYSRSIDLHEAFIDTQEMYKFFALNESSRPRSRSSSVASAAKTSAAGPIARGATTPLPNADIMFTIEAWVRPDNIKITNGLRNIISNGELSISLSDDFRYGFSLSCEGEAEGIFSWSNESFQDDKFHHLLLCFNPSTATLFIDGSPIVSKDYTASLRRPFNLSLLIGAGYIEKESSPLLKIPTSPFYGSIAEVRLWNIHLTQDTVVQRSRRSLLPSEILSSSLIGYYPLTADIGLKSLQNMVFLRQSFPLAGLWNNNNQDKIGKQAPVLMKFVGKESTELSADDLNHLLTNSQQKGAAHPVLGHLRSVGKTGLMILGTNITNSGVDKDIVFLPAKDRMNGIESSIWHSKRVEIATGFNIDMGVSFDSFKKSMDSEVNLSICLKGGSWWNFVPSFMADGVFMNNATKFSGFRRPKTIEQALKMEHVGEQKDHFSVSPVVEIQIRMKFVETNVLQCIVNFFTQDNGGLPSLSTCSSSLSLKNQNVENLQYFVTYAPLPVRKFFVGCIVEEKEILIASLPFDISKLFCDVSDGAWIGLSASANPLATSQELPAIKLNMFEFNGYDPSIEHTFAPLNRTWEQELLTENVDTAAAIPPALLQQVLVDDKDSWSCQACTAINKNSDSSCYVCSAPNPKAPVSTAAAAPNKPSKVKCPTCTYDNAPSASVCEMCTTKLPAQEDKSTNSNVDSNKSWSCPQCTLKNDGDAKKCSACDNPRPEKKDTPTPKPGSSAGDSSSSVARGNVADEMDKRESAKKRREEDEIIHRIRAFKNVLARSADVEGNNSLNHPIYGRWDTMIGCFTVVENKKDKMEDDSATASSQHPIKPFVWPVIGEFEESMQDNTLSKRLSRKNIEAISYFDTENEVWSIVGTWGHLRNGYQNTPPVPHPFSNLYGMHWFTIKFDKACESFTGTWHYGRLINNKWSGKLVKDSKCIRGLENTRDPMLIKKFDNLSAVLAREKKFDTSLSPFYGGLENMIDGLTNICYQNSLLQALFMTKDFIASILLTKIPDRSLIVKDPNGNSNEYLLMSFKKLKAFFSALVFGSGAKINSRDLQLILPDDFRMGRQMDVSDFGNHLLDICDRTFKLIGKDASQEYQMINDDAMRVMSGGVHSLFGVVTSTSRKCLVCGHEKKTPPENVLELPLSFPQQYKPVTDIISIWVSGDKSQAPPQIEIPENYEHIPLNLNDGRGTGIPKIYLCISRKPDKPPITDLLVKTAPFGTNPPQTPEGWTLVANVAGGNLNDVASFSAGFGVNVSSSALAAATKGNAASASSNAKDASLPELVFLYFKRDPNSSPITQITLISKDGGDSTSLPIPPTGFRIISKNLNPGGVLGDRQGNTSDLPPEVLDAIMKMEQNDANARKGGAPNQPSVPGKSSTPMTETEMVKEVSQVRQGNPVYLCYSLGLPLTDVVVAPSIVKNYSGMDINLNVNNQIGKDLLVSYTDSQKIGSNAPVTNLYLIEESKLEDFINNRIDESSSSNSAMEIEEVKKDGESSSSDDQLPSASASTPAEVAKSATTPTLKIKREKGCDTPFPPAPGSTEKRFLVKEFGNGCPIIQLHIFRSPRRRSRFHNSETLPLVSPNLANPAIDNSEWRTNKNDQITSFSTVSGAPQSVKKTLPPYVLFAPNVTFDIEKEPGYKVIAVKGESITNDAKLFLEGIVFSTKSKDFKDFEFLGRIKLASSPWHHIFFRINGNDGGMRLQGSRHDGYSKTLPTSSTCIPIEFIANQISKQVQFDDPIIDVKILPQGIASIPADYEPIRLFDKAKILSNQNYLPQVIVKRAKTEADKLSHHPIVDIGVFSPELEKPPGNSSDYLIEVIGTADQANGASNNLSPPDHPFPLALWIKRIKNYDPAAVPNPNSQLLYGVGIGADDSNSTNSDLTLASSLGFNPIKYTDATQVNASLSAMSPVFICKRVTKFQQSPVPHAINGVYMTGNIKFSLYSTSLESIPARRTTVKFAMDGFDRKESPVALLVPSSFLMHQRWTHEKDFESLNDPIFGPKGYTAIGQWAINGCKQSNPFQLWFDEDVRRSVILLSNALEEYRIEYIKDDFVELSFTRDVREHWENGQLIFSDRKETNFTQDLVDHYFARQIMSGSEAPQCESETCKNQSRPHIEGTSLLEAPNNLILTLKGAGFDILTNQATKNLQHVRLNEVLTIKRESEKSGSEILKYGLYAIVVHSGVNAHSGHYICYARPSSCLHPPLVNLHNDMTKSATNLKDTWHPWIYFNDTEVQYKSWSDLISELETSEDKTPYMLFYHLISSEVTNKKMLEMAEEEMEEKVKSEKRNLELSSNPDSQEPDYKKAKADSDKQPRTFNDEVLLMDYLNVIKDVNHLMSVQEQHGVESLEEVEENKLEHRTSEEYQRLMQIYSTFDEYPQLVQRSKRFRGDQMNR